MHQIRYLGQEVGLVHAERDGRDDDLVIALLAFGDLRISAHDDGPAARRVCVRDVFLIERDATGRKIRPLHELQEVVGGRFGIFDEVYRRVAHFFQIVRRDVGRHADRDAERSVQKKIWRCGRQNARLLFGVVVIGSEGDGLLVDIAHHFTREARHFCLGVAVRGRAVAVDGIVDEYARRKRKIMRLRHRQVIYILVRAQKPDLFTL